eukprot:GHRQ01038352.1.p3 GENE.GHRQ01038352.1~~GHRQ01038352.1.p3  ORF type:complete len:122 (-),score=25.78 GHRQ01038352.1:462-827(-)
MLAACLTRLHGMATTLSVHQAQHCSCHVTHCPRASAGGLASVKYHTTAAALLLCHLLRCLQVRNLQNEITKKCAPPCATTDAVFYAGTGLLLCRSEDKVRTLVHPVGPQEAVLRSTTAACC